MLRRLRPVVQKCRITLNQRTIIMADLAAYEQRASEAENLVKQLTQQVSVLRAQVEEQRLKQILAENEKLKAQVETAKRTLREAELANGKPQITIPNDPVAEEYAAKYAAQTGTKVAATPKEGKPVQPQGNAEPGKPADKADTKAEQPKKEKKKKQKSEKKPAAPAAADIPGISRVDFRVGLITEAKMHPDADSLYVETIDLGEAEPRTVISGLAKHVPLDKMQNRLIVLCANLKPRKMRGILSQGMVMCASGNDKVEPIAPPTDAKPGDVITFAGFERQPDAVLPPKKKIYEGVAPDLKTNDQGVATYQGIPFVVEGKGECKAAGMPNVPVQ
eukprot:TRINITY_DN11989_c0_g2_i1.p1 TRINITY_DN11989_c0_g2~~TRINITY_DN11989_c0_g2_i1.p1  ORF type:complete len:333 (+),score=80.48 TRINITY_DN11989_c0_g2_i1:43-1041(+)